MRIAFAGGGTAGHLYPALATALELRRRDLGLEGVFFVSTRGTERAILERWPFEVVELAVRGFGGRLSFGSAASAARLFGAYRAARRVMRAAGTEAVVGFGAFVSVAPVLAGRAAGAAVIIHEQNAVMGRANRCLLPLAHAVALGMPLRDGMPGGRPAVITGTPVRPGIREAPDTEAARAFLGLEGGRFTLLVMGGSLGAGPINAAMIRCAPLLERAGGFQIVHLSGGADYAAVVEGYARAGMRASVFPYLDRIEWAYSAADLAVCRCGAMTLAELALAGLPAILVPFPAATDDHQAANAAVYSREGAAVVMREESLSPERLAAEIASLREDEERRKSMSAAVRRCARPGAAAALADLVEKTVGRGRRRRVPAKRVGRRR